MLGWGSLSGPEAEPVTVGKNFVPIVLALTLVVYPAFGGLGLIALAAGAYFWHLAPYRRGVHSDMSEAHHTMLMVQQDAQQTLPGPRRPVRYFTELLLCAGLMFFGLVRLENTGFLGSLVLG